MGNTSSVSGSAVSQASVVSESHCLITGYLYDLTGDALAGYGLTIRYIHKPIGNSSSTLYLRERIRVRADNKGKVSFNLLQGATVKVEIPGRMLDMVRICNVPETTSADLLDIIFPRVSSAEFSQTTATLSAGDSLSITVTGTISDGTSLDVSGAVTLSTSDSAVATVSGNSITAVASGTATIGLSSVDLTKLSIGQEPDGDGIVRTGLSAPTLSSELTVTVS